MTTEDLNTDWTVMHRLCFTEKNRNLRQCLTLPSVWVLLFCHTHTHTHTHIHAYRRTYAVHTPDIHTHTHTQRNHRHTDPIYYSNPCERNQLYGLMLMGCYRGILSTGVHLWPLLQCNCQDSVVQHWATLSHVCSFITISTTKCCFTSYVH
ncbi:hypothetical protein AALO_G00214950 [Alosa alosa]|uniref:Uncharacterized protein n=1 Tax=Alosa alosa TaxID=278164 RepID=A0AAV6G580_9TELE|nr:hypothetical protein AALO_G00214950 [Alosa alosa]